MNEAVKQAEFIVTTTGCRDILREEHFDVIKDGCILANSGHFDNEISKKALEEMSASKSIARENVTEYTFADGRKIYLLAEGRLVNLAAGQGHPVEIMDMSFALQALAIEYLVENHGTLSPAVHQLPRELDEWVARAALRAMDVEIDELTDEQQKYLCDWREGT